MTQLLSERVVIDDQLNLLMIDGKFITAELLLAWTQPTQADLWFRVDKVDADRYLIHYSRSVDREGYMRGMEAAAKIVEDHSPCLAETIRTIMNGGIPCEDCGQPLPEHNPSCVARGLTK